MPIKVQCGNCSASFKAKDELAGRRVKCPKCKNPVQIGQPAASKPVASKPAASTRAANPLLDLLDEENVRSVARGPICGNCGAEVKRGAKICIDCGFNLETGDKLSTEAGEDVENAGGMTGTQQMLRKAERELEETTDDFDSEDFGDGAESYLIAGVAGFFGLLLIGIGMTVILTMEQLSLLMAPAGISLIASIGLFIGMWVWVSLVAFKASPAHGIACLASLGLYCPIFGFMQGKSLILPSIVILISILMMVATGIYVGAYGFAPTAV